MIFQLVLIFIFLIIFLSICLFSYFDRIFIFKKSFDSIESFLGLNILIIILFMLILFNLYLLLPYQLQQSYFFYLILIQVNSIFIINFITFIIIYLTSFIDYLLIKSKINIRIIPSNTIYFKTILTNKSLYKYTFIFSYLLSIYIVIFFAKNIILLYEQTLSIEQLNKDLDMYYNLFLVSIIPFILLLLKKE